MYTQLQNELTQIEAMETYIQALQQQLFDRKLEIGTKMAEIEQ